ncbi:Peptidyl-prolyl cis-trans isomerase fpr2 [Fusarium solani]|uniref:peptidylprolyl isomerase n=1 Tax=Fusarium solani TaxID=169388 RepID=A0A9P9H4D0_FUSSL|nr:FK506-binding protein 2 [Fusarium solani]KAH7250416.1 FK506-binding protein 2 [Fusarium solani]KAI8690517.1 Peptidylprolyl isomerase [Fusarium sp. Ph1]KAJ4222042.1 Peptidyl-prolyl cis-trans isomerase fpr2 [Fusarium solani]
MKAALILSVLASAAVGVVAEELKIDVTLPVVCERKTKNGDKIHMHYRGTLAADGSQFDASYDRGTPLVFKLGSGQVIKGWDQGLLDMCIGEKRTLTIPPEFGYGQRAIGPIPAGSTLIFETELVGIDGVPKPEKIETKVVEKAEPAAESAEEAAESATEKIAEKVASVVAEAADAAKTILADTDDAPVHEEL